MGGSTSFLFSARSVHLNVGADATVILVLIARDDAALLPIVDRQKSVLDEMKKVMFRSKQNSVKTRRLHGNH